MKFLRHCNSGKIENHLFPDCQEQSHLSVLEMGQNNLCDWAIQFWQLNVR
jgi:hypothetical protein